MLAARPGRVREIVAVELPEPRELAIRDTAMFGATNGVKCGLDFFGPSKIVFATDAPLGPIRKTYDGIAAMDLDAETREAIFYGNAAKLLRL
jgi:aminocarboxymuconate-semialdehyde decarboxylase